MAVAGGEKFAGDGQRLDGGRDIATRADIAGLLTDFYARAFADPLIGPIFTDVAHLDLPAHLPIMCDFWETALLGARAYRRNAFLAHRRLSDQQPLTPAHFARWFTLWTQTVDDRHAGPVADRAKLQAHRIAHSMSRRLDPEVQRHRARASCGVDRGRVEQHASS